jgi:lysophospholipase L1-like esterase
VTRRRTSPSYGDASTVVCRLLVALACASLLASVAACGTRAESQTRPEAKRTPDTPKGRSASAPLRIMPLGDSITDGVQVPGGYRTGLWQFLAADGIAAHFVGSEAGGPAQLPEREHEGHPGWRMGQIYLQVRGWLLSSRPQIVLLDIGTNDILQNKELAQAPARLSRLLDLITTTLPGVRVYVATIGPFGRPANEARARSFDARIPGIVRAMTSQGRHVQMVDMHAALGRSDLSSDGIHPTAGGYSKMAMRWYAALTSSTITRYEAENPAYAAVNNGVRLPTRAASGNAKVGYLNYADSYIEYSLTVPRTGSYRMYVHGADGMGSPCRQKLTVDGVAKGELSFANDGWDQWTVTAEDLWLRGGRNTVRLTRSVCSAEIDAIDLRPESPTAR